LSYNIYVDGSLAGNVLSGTVFYTESVLVTLGVTSEFKVTAINVIGEGSKSLGTSIIAAMAPY
jgi:hypothetical protein